MKSNHVSVCGGYLKKREKDFKLFICESAALQFLSTIVFYQQEN
jgi:hypothetical protein